EGRLSDAGDEPTSEGDFTAAVPSALVAGSSSGRRTCRLSMVLSPQAQIRGRKRATVATPDQERLAEPAAQLTRSIQHNPGLFSLFAEQPEAFISIQTA